MSETTHWPRDNQAGLEVVAQEHAKQSYPEPVKPEEPQLYAQDVKLRAGEGSVIPQSRRPRRKLLWIGIGAVVLIVIVGAVLGGVLGSRGSTKDKKDDSEEEPKASPGPGNTTISGSNAVLDGSAISVTGLRTESGYQIYLYYQGLDGQLWFSLLNSSSDGDWQSPSMKAANAANGTGIGASTIVWGDDDNVSTL